MYFNRTCLTFVKGLYMNSFCKKLGITLTALALFIGSEGCSRDDATSPGSPDVPVPGVGTTYTYNEHQELNGTRLNGAEKTIIAEVIETGKIMGSKSNVVHIREEAATNPDDTNHVYITYERNNDVAFLASEPAFGSAPPSLWITLPFGSKLPLTLLSVDTVIDNGMGRTDTLRAILKTSWVGEEKIQHQGEELTIWIGKVEQESLVNPGSMPIEIETEYAFVPAIGYFYRRESKIISSWQTLEAFRSLVSYTLK